MIQKYVFGQPVNTDAVVLDIPESQEEFSVMELTESDGIRLCCRMEEEDVVYGLGEQVRGINKRGFSYISYAEDDSIHIESRHSLYGAHNFLVLNRRNQKENPDGSRSFGIFVDDPGKVVFDVGETKRDQLVIQAGGDCVIYVIEGGG